MNWPPFPLKTRLLSIPVSVQTRHCHATLRKKCELERRQNASERKRSSCGLINKEKNEQTSFTVIFRIFSNIFRDVSKFVMNQSVFFSFRHSFLLIKELSIFYY